MAKRGFLGDFKSSVRKFILKMIQNSKYGIAFFESYHILCSLWKIYFQGEASDNSNINVPLLITNPRGRFA